MNAIHARSQLRYWPTQEEATIDFIRSRGAAMSGADRL
jgi:hypothetical protein